MPDPGGTNTEKGWHHYLWSQPPASTPLLVLTLYQPAWPPHCSLNTPGMVPPQVLCTGCFFCLEQALLPVSSWLVPSPAPRSLLKSPLAGTLPHHPAYLKWHTQPQLSTPFCFTFLSSPYHTQYTLLVLLTFCPHPLWNVGFTKKEFCPFSLPLLLLLSRFSYVRLCVTP